ncbi:MAG TPA: hypothetical protein VF475_01000 [Sphingobium sp.]
MHIQEPLPLYYSWPLFEAEERMGILGTLPAPQDAVSLDAALAARGTGIWECNLADSRLSWTSGVYDLFGLPHGAEVERSYIVSLYRGRSRRVMEQLRAHAITFRRGFSVDAHIRQAAGEERWMRLSAMPIIEKGKVVRLRGMKIDVTAQYDVPAPIMSRL